MIDLFARNDAPLEQVAPARAKKKFDDPENVADGLGWEIKIDGERFKIHTHSGGPFLHRCDSRCISKGTDRFTEKTDRVPHIMKTPIISIDSIFDCEFVSTGDEILVEVPGVYYDKLANKDHPHMKYFMEKYEGTIPVYPHVSLTCSVLGSLAEEAIRKQREQDAWIRAYAFDCIKHCGETITSKTQRFRRDILAYSLRMVDPEIITLMPMWENLTKREVADLFYLITNADGEGLIGKVMDAPYNAPTNWFKMKGTWPVDCVVTGEYKVGTEGKTGKMGGKVSSISVGVYHEGKLHHLGWMSAIMDSEAGLMTPEEFLASDWPLSVVEVNHNGLQVNEKSPIGHTLRHPRFKRRRFDKPAKDCTLATLKAEIAKKA